MGRLWFSVTASAKAWRDRGRAVEADGYIAVIDDWQPGKPGQGRVVATAQNRVRGDQAMAAQRSGSRRTSAANTARSAHSSRGLGLVRRSTATSWRSTRSSTSLVADVRPISRTSPSTYEKIK